MSKRAKKKKLTVLVVEDDTVYANGIQLFLKNQYNYITVKTVATIREALECLQKESYDVVCSDYKLPDGTGIELCEKAQKIREQNFVILSVWDQEECGEKFSALPIKKWIPKIPFAPEIIVESILGEADE